MRTSQNVHTSQKCPHLYCKMRILLVSVQQVQTHTYQSWLISLGLISIIFPLCVYQIDTIFLLPVRTWQWQEVVRFFCFSFSACVWLSAIISLQLQNCHGHSCCFLLTPSINKEICWRASQAFPNISAASISSSGSGSTWWRSWRRAKSLSSSPHTTSKRPGKPTWSDN